MHSTDPGDSLLEIEVITDGRRPVKRGSIIKMNRPNATREQDCKKYEKVEPPTDGEDLGDIMNIMIDGRRGSGISASSGEDGANERIQNFPASPSPLTREEKAELTEIVPGHQRELSRHVGFDEGNIKATRKKKKTGSIRNMFGFMRSDSFRTNKERMKTFT
uniref:Uncharacterized protein n=1 Tax=Lotharella globosa TaxID=91324 RepID=A0A7S4DF07_9EUKA